MSSKSFLTNGLLIGALLHHLTLASPVANLAARATATLTASVSTLSPNVINHGAMDGAALADLLQSLSSELGPTPTPNARRNVPRQAPLALTTASIGAFLAVDVGKAEVAGSPSECTTTTINGPIQTLQVSVGSSNMRALNVINLSGESTSITSHLEESVDAGTFAFNANERITEFFVFPTEMQFTGFNFTTSEGRTYSAISTVVGPNVSGIKVPVGSGILGRIRGVHCQSGLFGSMGFDFLDDLESVGISNITYSGFTNNILPSGPGETIGVGQQIIDNRNSSAEQSTTLLTSDAVTRTHSLTVTNQWDVGGRIAIEKEASVPFISKVKATAEFSWQVMKNTAEQDLTSEMITKAVTVILKCPARKFCVGSSFFTMYKMNVDVEATFNAKTKSGETFKWTQKGRYEGADSMGVELRVDEVDSPSAAKRAL